MNSNNHLTRDEIVKTLGGLTSMSKGVYGNHAHIAMFYESILVDLLSTIPEEQQEEYIAKIIYQLQELHYFALENVDKILSS